MSCHVWNFKLISYWRVFLILSCDLFCLLLVLYSVQTILTHHNLHLCVRAFCLLCSDNAVLNCSRYWTWINSISHTCSVWSAWSSAVLKLNLDVFLCYVFVTIKSNQFNEELKSLQAGIQFNPSHRKVIIIVLIVII